jgi:AcrR family transcriptional regulator
VPRRKYEQRLRAESADATRRRILDAAYEAIRASPGQPVSVDAIARAAGASRSTVYLVFGSRTGLLEALRYDVIERGGYRELLEATSHPDAREHLRGGIRAGVRIFAADRDVLRTLQTLGRFDESGGPVERWDDERARGMQRVAAKLQEQGLLRPDTTAEDAAHVLWVLTSFDAFDLLYTDRGLPEAEVARLLAATAERAVCIPADG